MVLYAVKVGEHYLRDRKDKGITLEAVDHCSVFSSREAAKKSATAYGIEQCNLIEMVLTENEIPW